MAKKDKELMMEYKSGNIEALEEIFQRYKKRILNYSMRLLDNLADAEDIVGEAFYILTVKKDAYMPTAKFSSWIYSIAHNLCIDRIRKRRRLISTFFKRKDTDEYEELDIPDMRPAADEELQKKEVSGLIKKAIHKLPTTYQEAIILKEYENLSYEEIAEIMSCSVNKVRVLIFRARERLKKSVLPLVKEVR